MAEPVRESIRREAPVSPEPACCDASRHATADRQFRILERLAEFAAAHTARRLACEQSGELDRHHGFARPPFPLPAESSAPFAPSRAATRIAAAELAPAEAEAKIFLAARP